MEFKPPSTSAGLATRSDWACMATLTIEAESAAGTPCPETSEAHDDMTIVVIDFKGNASNIVDGSKRRMAEFA